MMMYRIMIIVTFLSSACYCCVGNNLYEIVRRLPNNKYVCFYWLVKAGIVQSTVFSSIAEICLSDSVLTVIMG